MIKEYKSKVKVTDADIENVAVFWVNYLRDEFFDLIKEFEGKEINTLTIMVNTQYRKMDLNKKLKAMDKNAYDFFAWVINPMLMGVLNEFKSPNEINTVGIALED